MCVRVHAARVCRHELQWATCLKQGVAEEREEKHEREKKQQRLQMLKSERAWFLPQFLVSFSKTYHHKQQNSHEREWGKSGEKNKGEQLQQTSRLCFPIRLCDSIILLDALH